MRRIGDARPSTEEIEGYREQMRKDGLVNSSQFNTLTALQHWLGFHGIEVRFKKPRRKRKSPTYLTESEASRLLEACKTVKERTIAQSCFILDCAFLSFALSIELILTSRIV